MIKCSEIMSGHSHSFDTGIAQYVGIEAAIVFNHIVYWLKINAQKADAKMINGRYWMYETNKQISDFFGYFSEDQIQRILKKLVDSGLILKDNFNKNKFDRTSWYAIADEDTFKKMFSKPQASGMVQSANLRNENRKPAETLYEQYNNQVNTQEEQQQAADADAAVFSDSKDKKTQSQQSNPKTANQRIYDCLKEIAIPEKDKNEISQRHDEDTVQNAIKWATAPNFKPTKGLAAAIKWACQNKIKPEKNENEQIEENIQYAMKYDNDSIGIAKVDVLSKYVEISFPTSCKPSFCLNYIVKGFKDKLNEALIATGFQLKTA